MAGDQIVDKVGIIAVRPFARRLSSRSASLTSSSRSLPDLTRCMTTSWERPPNIASNSSMRRSCAASRETRGSKRWKLPIFPALRTIFFASMR